MTTPLKSAGIYEFLPFAYPGQFRRKYAPQMASVFAENCRHISGFPAVLGLWLATLADLLIGACAKHSVFFSGTKKDLVVISRAPVFAAASGALVGGLFFIHAALVRIHFDPNPGTLEPFDPLATATLSIAFLWLSSELALFLVRRTRGATAFKGMPFATGLAAFQHLASIAMALAFCAVGTYGFSDVRFSSGTFHFTPASHQGFVLHMIRLATVSGVTLLQPFLTLRCLSSLRFLCKHGMNICLLQLDAGDNALKHF